MSAPEKLSHQAARRAALHAQGFCDPRPREPTAHGHVRRVLDRLGVVQVDSVNVLVRSHHLPFFSRLGAYPKEALGHLLVQRREIFEYWGHEASVLPVSSHPLLRWRMARAERESWARMRQIARDQPGLVADVLAEVRARGPLCASELSLGTHRPHTGMWAWSEGKIALEWLFWSGQLTSAGRRPSFERAYDLPERVLPAAVLAAPTPHEHEAQRQLLLRAAQALGVATARDLADYYRIRLPEARARLAELLEAGALLPAQVEGCREAAFLHPQAVIPERVPARALLSPFDSLVWERGRTERLFGMRLRLEIYTPAERRVHGYYVLPFLFEEALAARVDLKADRAASTLRVLSAFAEPGQAHPHVAAALAEELRRMAAWLDLADVKVGRRGDLARELAAAVRTGAATAC